MSRYAILIPNWNGLGVIEKCLASVMTAAREIGETMELVVIDDASTDDSPRVIQGAFPSARLLRLETNIGFGAAVNRGMHELKAPWVFLLNNDLALMPDFFARLEESREELDDPELFAIGARTLHWGTREPNHAGMNARWRGGMIVQEPFEAETLAKSDFFQAGACLISRERFLELGGFSTLYHPGYWEDYDLAYRARRNGWNNYYEPRAEAHHWGKRSMASLLGSELDRVIRRNHLLFNWANLDDAGLLARHFAGLGALALQAERQAGRMSFPWGGAMIAALGKLGEALRARRSRSRKSKATDRELLIETMDRG